MKVTFGRNEHGEVTVHTPQDYMVMYLYLKEHTARVLAEVADMARHPERVTDEDEQDGGWYTGGNSVSVWINREHVLLEHDYVEELTLTLSHEEFADILERYVHELRRADDEAGERAHVEPGHTG